MAEGFLIEKMVVEKSYRLELTEEEATFLSVLLGSVGGDPDGYRGYSDNINRALYAANLNDKNREADKLRQTELGEKMKRFKEGHVMFNDTPSRNVHDF